MNKWKTYNVSFEGFAREDYGFVEVKARNEWEALRKADRKLEQNFDHVETFIAEEQ